MLIQNRLVSLLADKMVREERIIPVAEVARACGMSRQAASKWFSNQIKAYPIDTTAALCRYFNCTPGDFFVLKGSEASQ